VASSKKCEGGAWLLRIDRILLQIHQGLWKIARPLIDLTKKDGFKWGDSEQTTFEFLKEKKTTRPVLVLPDFSQEFIIESDALGHGLGAILFSMDSQWRISARHLRTEI